MIESYCKFLEQGTSVNMQDFEKSLYGVSAWGESVDQRLSPIPIKLKPVRKKIKVTSNPRSISPNKLPKIKSPRVELTFSNNLNSHSHKTKIFKRKTFVQERKNLSICIREYKSPLYRMNSDIKPEKQNLFNSPILYFLPKIAISKAGLVKRAD